MNWAYYASGFREDRGEHTGTKENAHRVRDLYQAQAVVAYVEWDDNPEGHAQSLAAQWTSGDTLIVTGYSWGCGNWIKKFLWELHRLNPTIIVDHLLLVDPVVRSRWPWMRWLAVSPWGTINLPENVEEAFVFFQRVNEPNASVVQLGGRVVTPHKELFVPHTKIDNHLAVRTKVLQVAEKYLSTP